MSTPSFSRPGAVDLSALAARSKGGSAGVPGRFTVEITSEESLRADVVAQSSQVVVLMSFWAPQVPESLQLNDVLSKLAEEYDGQFLFATLDVSALPELAQALGVPGVPLVLAALQGQLAPLLQQALPESEMRAVVDQVLQAAAANGITGRAQPRGDAPPDGDQGLVEPPARHPEAEAALEAGDVETAIAAFDLAVRADPTDEEARVGAIRARLLQRTMTVDIATARAAAAAAPADVSAQQTVADLDLLDGDVDAAFSRLLDLLTRVSGDEKDAIRMHLLDLFLVVGQSDPRVAKARQRLAAAVF
jgi:putative thioredoxin